MYFFRTKQSLGKKIFTFFPPMVGLTLISVFVGNFVNQATFFIQIKVFKS